jgi:hypothetical protein
VKFDDDDHTSTKLTETETFYLTYSMIATRKEGKREEISNYIKILTKGIVGLNRNKTSKFNIK